MAERVVRQFRPVHLTWHLDVGEQHIHRLRLCLKMDHRRDGMPCLKHGKTGICQRFSSERVDEEFIFDYDYTRLTVDIWHQWLNGFRFY